jgi:outer membrane protein
MRLSRLSEFEVQHRPQSSSSYVFNTRITVLILALIFGNSHAFASSLSELHRKAVINDPALSGAEAQIDASGERVKEARAALLPTFSVNGQANRSRYTRDAANAFSNNSSNNTFTSRQFSEQLSQPLYKPGLWTALKQSHVMVDAATAQRDVAYADLTQRFSRAYFDVLIAQ